MNFAPLADVADIFMGQSPPGSTYNTDGNGLPFFQGKTDFGDIYPTVRMFCTEPKRIAEVNDILISVRAPVGPTNLAPIKSAIGRGLAAIRCKDGTDVKYLLYFLRHNEPDLAQLGKGSTFEAIGRDDLEDVRVPFPLLPEQRRIAALLDKADHLRRTRRYAAQLSETFLQAVFVRMFGEPVTNLLHFPLEKLEDLIDPDRQITYGIVLPGDNVEGGVPYVRVVDMKEGQINSAGLRRTTRAIADSYKRSSLKPGDLLLSIRGQVGRLAIVPKNLDGANITQDTARLATTEKINVLYLMGCLDSAEMQEYMRNLIKGAAIQGINLGDVKEFMIPVLSPSDKEKFARIVQQFERLRAQQREAERQAEHLFQTLLHRAFGGEG